VRSAVDVDDRPDRAVVYVAAAVVAPGDHAVFLARIRLGRQPRRALAVLRVFESLACGVVELLAGVIDRGRS
jgi:hypothetical protein